MDAFTMQFTAVEIDWTSSINVMLHLMENLLDYVAPICMPREQQMDNLKLGELVTVAGWGKMNMSTEERAHILQFVSVSGRYTYYDIILLVFME